MKRVIDNDVKPRGKADRTSINPFDKIEAHDARAVLIVADVTNTRGA